MAEQERIQIPDVLESVLRYCLKDASGRMAEGKAIVPFSALAVGDTLFMEEHSGDEPADSFHSARKTVENARGAKAYGFCYDGYIEVQNGIKRDCLIAEGGVPGEEYGHAIGLLYKVNDDGTATFEDEPIYVGSSLNYMLHLGNVEGDEPEGDSEEEDVSAGE